MAVVRWALLIVLTVAACGDPAPPVGDDDAGPDAETPGDSGLELRWTSVGMDGPVGEVTLDECRLWLADLRIVGDAAPGDDRTYLAKTEIKLDGGAPPVQRFDDAPPGRYSTVDFSTEGLSDSEPAWRIRGSVALGDEIYDLEIEDDDGFSRSLPLSGLVLGAGETRRINLEVDLVAVLAGVDWESMPRDGDVIEIDDDTPELGALRARLVTAITVESIE
jgi:hypothetical protein